jgi:RNA polymerase sigma-70 factor (ECF subfamily)
MNMDNELFWKLLEPIHPKAESFCRKLAGNRDDGDDLYQEAMINAMSRFTTLKDKNSFQPWLFRIIINNFKNRLRAPWWSRITFRPHPSDSTAHVDPRSQFDSRRWLDRALTALSSEDKAMIILYELEGWSIPEMKTIFKKPEGTIKARLWRARRKMRRKLESYLTGSSVNSDIKAETNVGGNYALQRSDTTDK